MKLQAIVLSLYLCCEQHILMNLQTKTMIFVIRVKCHQQNFGSHVDRLFVNHCQNECSRDKKRKTLSKVWSGYLVMHCWVCGEKKKKCRPNPVRVKWCYHMWQKCFALEFHPPFLSLSPIPFIFPHLNISKITSNIKRFKLYENNLHKS